MTNPYCLPNAEQAYIPEGKVENYLLSFEHAVGGAKARFFTAIGYTRQDADLLKQQLLRIAREGDLQQEVVAEHGVKYVVDGQLHAPSGRLVEVRTVWIIGRGETAPRLVTVYPR
jgi:hypothetical protein